MKNILNKKLIISFLFLMCFLPAFRMNAQAKYIYTGNMKVDTAAEEIIRRSSKEGMTDKQKLRAAYNYLVKKMKYSHSDGSVKVHPSQKNTAEFKAKLKTLKKEKKVTFSSKFSRDYRNLLTLQGTCKDMSGVMCILANHLGFSASYCQGTYVRSNGSTTEHWWNNITVKGRKYYCDVQAANSSWNSHKHQPAVNGYYMKTYNNKGWRKHHRG